MGHVERQFEYYPSGWNFNSHVDGQHGSNYLGQPIAFGQVDGQSVNDHVAGISAYNNMGQQMGIGHMEGQHFNGQFSNLA